MTELEGRSEFKPVYEVIPPLVLHLNQLVNLVAVEKALRDPDTEDPNKKRYTPKYIIRINPTYTLDPSVDKPLMTQDFKGTERDFTIARRWIETALITGIPDALRIDLSNVTTNLSLIKQALLKVHKEGHTVRLSSKPAV
ncbi:MAG: hypothetical protein ABSE17_02995 [Candidatus Levyibacteriota bacterium]|jgi:hypothetical protein